MNPQLQLMLQQAIQAFQSGNLERAYEILKRCLKRAPQNFDMLHLLAVVCASQSKHHEALDYYKAAAAFKPKDESVLSNWGASLNAVGQNEEAIVVFKKALELGPNDPEIWYNAANTLCDLGIYEEALAYYKKSIEFDPEYFQAFSNYGKALFDLRRYSESLAYFENALSINPSFLDGLVNKGEALRMLKRFDEAIACYDKALGIWPNYHQAWSNKGVALYDLDRFEEAIACYDKALGIWPNYHQAWSNKGMALHELKRFDEAIAHYDKALSLKSDYHEASWNKSLSLLLQGDFENGLPLYESRWYSKKISEIAGKRSFQKPTWLGVESLKGKTILLYAEQGLGDFIQFCRYTKLVADFGAKVILEVPQPLADLMKDLDGVSQLVINGQELPFFDYQCPLLSLPLASKTNLSNIPNAIRYINIDNHQNKTLEWKTRLGPKLKPRVGLVWSGNPNHKNDHNRSLLLENVLPFLSSQFEYVSIQKEVREVDNLTLNSNPHILNFASHLNDFVDTAALIENLDLVISVDTSVAHLSGALGKKTWTLLPNVPDWRWLLDRGDSPWYPSMKLYRQTCIGDWNSMLERVKLDLSDNFNFVTASSAA